MNEPIHIGNQKQLFLDSFLIEWCDKVKRRVCPVTKPPENPVIRPVADWEPSGYIAYGSVLYDEEDEIYKAWCFGLGDAGTSRQSREVISGGVYYFTSTDGIHWEKPALDVVTLEGRPTNVVVLASHSQHEKRWPGFYELFGVSKNQSDPDPTHRYKMGYLYLMLCALDSSKHQLIEALTSTRHKQSDYHGPGEARFHSGQRRGLGVAFSPDGIHWTPMSDAVTQATCDGATHWFYDEKGGRYILYGRTKHIAPEVRARYGEYRLFQRSHWGRAVNRAESEDFVHWIPDVCKLVGNPSIRVKGIGEVLS